MIFFPGILNIIYFWITDSYLKSNKHETDADGNKGSNELSPVKQLGESVTPYSQMEASGDELNGRQYGTVTNAGSAASGTLV
jgi:hypothetical protein